MLDEVKVHSRVHLRHPEIEDADVIAAWNNAIVIGRREFEVPDILVAVGADTKGRLLEMIGVDLGEDGILVFHGARLTRKVRDELGL